MAKDYVYTKNSQIEDALLPKRAEILNIVREHKIVSFDQIKRRFFAVNSRTLHYDLEYLMKSRLIRKLGSTNGARYIPCD